MTVREYAYRMRAYSLSYVDRMREMHLQAWLNNQVGATKQEGKTTVPVYRRFKDFFDYEQEVAKITGENKKLTDRQRRMAQVAKQLNKRKE